MAKIYRVDGMVQATAISQTRDLDELTAAYDRFTTSPDFQAAFPNYQGIPMMRGFGGRSAAFRRGSQRWIRLGSNRSEAVMLHEIAHHAADLHPDKYGPRTSHGPGFAAAFLDIVTMYQGQAARDGLIAAYYVEKIKVWSEGRTVLLYKPTTLTTAAAKALGLIREAQDARKLVAASRRERQKLRDKIAARRPDTRNEEERMWDNWEAARRSAAAKRAWETRRARQAASIAAMEGE
jgi:hypothetical protein